MSISFLHPLWLLAALAALPLVVHLAVTSHTGLASWRWWTSLVSRFSMVAALILALAGLTLHRERDELSVYFVLDASKSLDLEARRTAEAFVTDALRTLDPAKDRAGLILVGAHASIEHGLASSFDPATQASVLNTDFTNLADGIRLAVAAFPEGTQRRIVLLTDGKENLGDAVEAAQAAAAAGIEVWTVPLRRTIHQDVAIRKISVPPDVKLGESFDALIHLHSSGSPGGRPTPVKLHVWRNRRFLGTLETEVRSGEDLVPIPQKIRPKDEKPDEGLGTYEYEVVVETPGDEQPENNRSFAFTHVAGESRMALIEGKPGESEALARALAGAGIRNLDVLSPAQIPSGVNELQLFDAIVLSDVSAQHFTGGEDGTMKMLHDYVEGHGGGLIMIGGDRSFGVGGYFRTWIEEALPVTMDIRKKKYRASMATVIAIDQSGSMSMTVPGRQTKIELANEAACRAVELLRPDDEVGILYVDTEPKWAWKLQPATDRAEIYSRIRSNRGGGGGIYVKTALWEAWESLDSPSVQAAIKHIILFADAADSEQQEDCVARARKERQKGRTLTVIGMGTPADQDAKFLEELARAADGRYYITDDVRNLPRIFTEDILLASKSAIVEKTFPAKPVSSAAATEGIDWSTAPPLHGYVTTTLKPRGEMILQALEEEDPLLAKWQYGLGRSIAFTSDAKSKWAKDWIGWDGFGRFWSQLLRWTARKRAPVPYRTQLTFGQGKGKIVLDAYDEKGDPKNFLDLEAYVTHRDGRPQRVRLAQKSTGRYEAEFDAEKAGTYFTSVADRGGQIVGRSGSAIAYPPEFEPAPPRLHLLEDVARAGGGRLLEMPLGIFAHTGRIATTPQEVWPFLLGLALALLIADVVSRRIAIPDLVFALVDRIRALRARRAESKPKEVTPELARLLQAKEQAVAKEPSAPAAEIVKALENAPTASISPHPIPAPPLDPVSSPPTPQPPVPADFTARLLEAKRRAQKNRSEP